MKDRFIYHVCKSEEFDKALEMGCYEGSSQDKSDGFIHFSSKEQVQASTTKHRAGQDHLTLLEVDTTLLGEELIWEPSRGGKLFPHLYGVLPVPSITRTASLRLQEGGSHNVLGLISIYWSPRMGCVNSPVIDFQITFNWRAL